MQYTRLGMILVTDKYEDCVAFYRDVLQLTIMFEFDRPGSVLTCFDYGGAYLMIEPGGPPAVTAKDLQQSPVKLRFNVLDVESAAAELETKNVAVDVQAYDWGTVAEFNDPDGNRCALRSEGTFSK